MKDPIYNVDCVVSDEFPNESRCYRLLDCTELSYSLHRNLLDRSDLFPFIREFNDYFHRTKKENRFLKYCIEITDFMYDAGDFVTIQQVIDTLRSIKK